MADPFEVRMRFTNLLTHLSASATASIKTAHFALKHRDMDEDLHSCILENLERGNNMNNRANIMYFLEHHADVNTRDGGHEPYVDMVRRDIARIVDAVAQSGANVKVVRRVVTGLGEKGVLKADVVTVIETGLKEKEEKLGRLLGGDEEEDDNSGVAAPSAAAGSGGVSGAVAAAVSAKGQGDGDAMDTFATGPGDGLGGGGGGGGAGDSARPTPRTGAGQSGKGNGVSKVDKRAIEQRIEEDRERNKRLRESVWAVSGDDEQELDKMWEESTLIGRDEHVIADEEADERRQFVRYRQALLGR
jgi:CTD kinase subunit gamma